MESNNLTPLDPFEIPCKIKLIIDILCLILEIASEKSCCLNKRESSRFHNPVKHRNKICYIVDLKLTCFSVTVIPYHQNT
jgi:hypothetical protein